ncbi:hypothetical protein M6D81_09850 [Paenibacillus sp. J5C_2022]|uniref:hypothetical protein n=1 Tax=Paenibacillus sp. J5C2022 TaxID=2977129 RepID=UPI0021D1BAFD|nr:hypothetical protein [Paenibacillus sp. J5C2022]MCU6709022.1 hypothetical protein [Paenibacillus sp. J5C2022]
MTQLKRSTLNSYSGIYPHLAVTNGPEQMESGIGAVVPWAGKLWYLTYPASSWKGSDGDKLYSLNQDLQVEINTESVGGTHANRMIHRESDQLIIGLYFINAAGTVRTVPPEQMQGRLTAVARHLTDPVNRVYFFTMEGGIYEVNVHSLEVTTHAPDPMPIQEDTIHLLDGKHAKGAYTGQGRFVITNNGDGGGLVEWTGNGDMGNRDNWTTVDRNKYTDVTGPGDIYGSPDDTTPLWALGWDHKSVLLNLCEEGKWTRFRLPKASYTHEADHGHFTEWPRIREIGAGKWLMDMFGQTFSFPPTFSRMTTAGIRPLSVHHKMIVDFAAWNDRIVMACNDASRFDNAIVGRQQSNLMFEKYENLKHGHQPFGWGGVWMEEAVKANASSEPFLLAGYKKRVLHLSHTEKHEVAFQLEMDREGNGEWEYFDNVKVSDNGYKYYVIPEEIEGEWVRIRVEQDVQAATAFFYYTSACSSGPEQEMVQSLSRIGDSGYTTAGIIRLAEDDKLTLQLAASLLDNEGRIKEQGYYEIGQDMVLRKADKAIEESRLRNEFAPVAEYTVDDASFIMMDKTGRRFRLPKCDNRLDSFGELGANRCIREVVTERSLMHIDGTFYELPRDESGGLAKIQPISSHAFQIYDFASWRGMLVLSGCRLDAEEDSHYLKSEDGKAGLWLGNVDDIRRFGTPRGVGGPFKQTSVQAGEPSDAYLMLGYVHKSVEFSHNLEQEVEFSIEVDIHASGNWLLYGTWTVAAGVTKSHRFPDEYNAHWVRVTVDQSCSATATFIYE